MKRLPITTPLLFFWSGTKTHYILYSFSGYFSIIYFLPPEPVSGPNKVVHLQSVFSSLFSLNSSSSVPLSSFWFSHHFFIKTLLVPSLVHTVYHYLARYAPVVWLVPKPFRLRQSLELLSIKKPHYSILLLTYPHSSLTLYFFISVFFFCSECETSLRLYFILTLSILNHTCNLNNLHFSTRNLFLNLSFICWFSL